MASKNTKQTLRDALMSLPLMPLMFHIRWTLDNTKDISMIDGTPVDMLPKVVEGTLKVDRIIGWWHDPAFEEMQNFAGQKMLYKAKVYVTTAKTDEPVEVSLSALLKKESLMTFMLNKAHLLYLNAGERKMAGLFRDRNFTEILSDLLIPTLVPDGMGGLRETTAEEKVARIKSSHGSKDIEKLMKADIKVNVILNKAEAEQNYQESALSLLTNYRRALPGAAETLRLAEAAALAKKQLKAIKA